MGSTIYDKDHARIVLIVVCGLGLVMLALYGIIGGLLFNNRPVPGELWQASGAALGAFSALLVKTSATSSASAPVEEVPNDDPAPGGTAAAPDVVAAGGGVDVDELGGHETGAAGVLLLVAFLIAAVAIGLGAAVRGAFYALLILAAVFVVLEVAGRRRR